MPPAAGNRRRKEFSVRFFVTHRFPLSRSLSVPAGLLALIVATGCGSSNWTANQHQTPPSVADVAAHVAAGATTTPPVLLFVGTGTTSGSVSAVKTLLGNLKLSYATATSSQLNGMGESGLRAYKLLIVPGGDAITISKNLSSTAINNIHNAIVNDGLHYFGICAGAFFAGHSGVYHYLDLTPTGVWFNYYADKFKGISKEAVEIRGADGNTLDQYWENGPQLSGWGKVVGKYPDGTPTIVENYAGKGWVILCAVHPEATAAWRTGMTFTTSVATDNAYGQKLITNALNGTSLPHY
jgi:glutamine amidotransferase PdxT